MNINCSEHGERVAAVVCTHLLHERDRVLGFVENSSDPEDLQGWCRGCETVYAKEGDLTPAFREFNDFRLVCSTCYHVIKEFHLGGGAS